MKIGSGWNLQNFKYHDILYHDKLVPICYRNLNFKDSKGSEEHVGKITEVSKIVSGSYVEGRTIAKDNSKQSVEDIYRKNMGGEILRKGNRNNY